jgi:hypothetical protein
MAHSCQAGRDLMPDQSDAENALAQLVTDTLYPSGAGAASTIGTTVRVYRGWPNSAALDADLAAGIVNVTIFPVPGATRDTTRYPPVWRSDTATPSLTATVNGTTATFAGIAATGQLAGMLVDGKAYVHRLGLNETPPLVAAILGAAIIADRPAIVVGASVTTPGTIPIARTAADATATAEVRRQAQTFRITAWCPNPSLRDAICAAIDPAFAATPFVTLIDGSAGRLRFVSTTTFDQSQDAALYRRDLLYSVEFPTTLAANQPSMLFGTVGLGAAVITV